MTPTEITIPANMAAIVRQVIQRGPISADEIDTDYQIKNVWMKLAKLEKLGVLEKLPEKDGQCNLWQLNPKMR